jgi:hypothetical protein
MGFKVPDFAERAKLAQEAKQRALDKLRAKPAPDPAAVAAKVEAAAAKEAAAAEKREARRAEMAEAKTAKNAERAEREAAEAAAAKPLTPEEQKAIRDAKYAARKARRR